MRDVLLSGGAEKARSGVEGWATRIERNGRARPELAVFRDGFKLAASPTGEAMKRSVGVDVAE